MTKTKDRENTDHLSTTIPTVGIIRLHKSVALLSYADLLERALTAVVEFHYLATSSTQHVPIQVDRWDHRGKLYNTKQ